MSKLDAINGMLKRMTNREMAANRKYGEGGAQSRRVDRAIRHKLEAAKKNKHMKKSALTNRFYCLGCNVTYVSKSDAAKCSCGKSMSRILRESNIGKSVKAQRYEETMIKGTEFFNISNMRKVLNPDMMEMKIAMLRKYGDLAIGDKVRIGKGVGEKIVSAIEKYGPQKLDENSKTQIMSLSGTVTGFNARKNEVTITWDKGSNEIVGRYNTNGFDFFDLGGRWSDWDLDRIITTQDVGLTGSVNREGAAGSLANEAKVGSNSIR